MEEVNIKQCMIIFLYQWEKLQDWLVVDYVFIF